MSDYRRFVSYLYEYKNGQKTQSRGFLKAESKNDIFKLEIHIKDTALSASLPVDIYGFTRDENRLSGVLLGSTKSGNGAAGCCLKTSSKNLNHSSVPFQALKGIIILCNDTVCYASAWDDLPVIVSEFTKSTELSKNQQTETKKTENISQKQESSSANQESVPTQPEERDDASPEEPTLETEEVKEQEPLSETQPSLRSLRWQNLSEQLEAFTPFSDGFLSECVKFGLKDLTFLRKEHWLMGSNPFMIHSYSTYKHFILGRIENTSSFILGIPGTYHPKEKFMAEMYGFPFFKATNPSAQSPRCPGYWYRILD